MFTCDCGVPSTTSENAPSTHRSGAMTAVKPLSFSTLEG